MSIAPIDLNTYSLPTANAAASASASEQDFSSVLSHALETVNQSQQSADQLVAGLSEESSSTDLHNVMIAMQKADVLLKTAVQVRDRVVNAYQEMMRMQV